MSSVNLLLFRTFFGNPSGLDVHILPSLDTEMYFDPALLLPINESSKDKNEYVNHHFLPFIILVLTRVYEGIPP
jgi:hypothetical protein